MESKETPRQMLTYIDRILGEVAGAWWERFWQSPPDGPYAELANDLIHIDRCRKRVRWLLDRLPPE